MGVGQERCERGDRGRLPISSGEGSSPCRAAAARCRRGGASGGWVPSCAPPPPTMTTPSPSPPPDFARGARWWWWWDRGGRICRGVAPTIPSLPTTGLEIRGNRGGRGGRGGGRADPPAVASNCQRQPRQRPLHPWPSLPRLVPPPWCELEGSESDRLERSDAVRLELDLSRPTSLPAFESVAERQSSNFNSARCVCNTRDLSSIHHHQNIKLTSFYFFRYDGNNNIIIILQV